ncbi:MAG: hypothetical protein SGBAC_012343 [Bacillariaceae sp.]
MRFVLCLAAAVTVGHAQEHLTHVTQRAELLQKEGVVTSEWEDDKAAQWLVMIDTWVPSPDKREEQMKERLALASILWSDNGGDDEDEDGNEDGNDDGNDIASGLNSSDFYYECKSCFVLH